MQVPRMPTLGFRFGRRASGRNECGEDYIFGVRSQMGSLVEAVSFVKKDGRVVGVVCSARVAKGYRNYLVPTTSP